MDVGLALREVLQDVNQQVSNQILAGNDPHLLPADVHREGLIHLAGSLEEGERVRKEALTGVGQHRQAAGAANLAIELDAKLRLERQEPVAQPLLGDRQDRRGGADLTVAGDLDECAHLIGADVGKPVTHTTMKMMTSRINNYDGHGGGTTITL